MQEKPRIELHSDKQLNDVETRELDNLVQITLKEEKRFSVPEGSEGSLKHESSRYFVDVALPDHLLSITNEVTFPPRTHLVKKNTIEIDLDLVHPHKPEIAKKLFDLVESSVKRLNRNIFGLKLEQLLGETVSDVRKKSKHLHAAS